MYPIIGKHSLFLQHCQDFPCKHSLQKVFQPPRPLPTSHWALTSEIPSQLVSLQTVSQAVLKCPEQA